MLLSLDILNESFQRKYAKEYSANRRERSDMGRGCIPVWGGQGTGRRRRPPSCLSLGNPLDYRISPISPRCSSAAPPEHSLSLSRDALRCPLAVVSAYPSFSFSHHSHRILSIAIIGTLHTANPSGPRTNTEYPLASVLRVEGRLFFSVALNTEHSSTLCNRRIRARGSPSPRGETESEWILVSRSDARRGRG